MGLIMAISFPYTFAGLSGNVPLSYLDGNFAAINAAIGTSANNLVALDGSGKLPAVDGSQLTGLSGVVLNPTLNRVTTSVVMTSNVSYYYNTPALTLTLPPSPANSDRITIVNEGSNTDCIIARNGKNIMGSASDMTIDMPNVSVTLIYVNANSEADWRIL